ncbi:MAG: T9SS type A sorting domain-containing protein [Bacteroidota bacterium]
MKKKLLFGSIMFGLALTSTAQITINRSDLGNLIGAQIIQANDSTNLNLLSPGSAGANQTWNLTGIGNDYKDTMQFLSPAGTPCSDSFPTATLAGKQQGMFFYIYDDNTVLEMLGYCGVFVAPDTSVVSLTPPQKQAIFPSTYNTSFSGQTKQAIQFPYSSPPIDSGKQVSHISYTSLIDGWGNVTTPAGTYPSLRQKYTKYQTDSTFFHITGTGWTFYGPPTIDTTIEYSWWSQHNPFIANIVTNWSGIVQSANYLLSSNLVVNEIRDISNTVNVFPNPSNGKFTLEVLGDKRQGASLAIYNILGEIIYTAPIQKQQTLNEIDLSISPKGIYFVKIYDGEKIYTEKIVIQ